MKVRSGKENQLTIKIITTKIKSWLHPRKIHPLPNIISEVANALFITYFASEYIVADNISHDSSKKYLENNLENKSTNDDRK